jgi:acyl-CoA synthetase (AMP-forming)/AMP-acid ligase II
MHHLHITGRQSFERIAALMDRVAAALQRDGIQPGDVIAICATSSTAYAVTYLGALRAGVVVAPLAPGATAQSLAGMLYDAQARLLFTDADVADVVVETFGCDPPPAYVERMAERNPRPLVASFHLGPHSGKADVATRVRLAGTQKVTVLAALSNGGFRIAEAEVLVTSAACLDESL